MRATASSDGLAAVLAHGIIPAVTLSARLLREAIDEPLRPFGFSQVGRRQVWMRQATGLDHAVSLESGRGGWSVRWDIVHPGVGELLHGRRAQPADVRYTGFIVGTARSSLRPGVIAHFGRDDLQDGVALSRGLALAAVQVAEWTADFTAVQEVIAYLTQRPGQKLRDPRVTIPGNWPFRLFTAAALAVVSGYPDAQGLGEAAIKALAPWRGRTTDERIQRLEDALS